MKTDLSTLRKMLILFVFLIIGIAATNAQVYVGGSLQWYKVKQQRQLIENSSIAPELGYSFHHNAVGISIGYATQKMSFPDSPSYWSDDYRGITITPYFRKGFLSKDKFCFFIDLAFENYIYDIISTHNGQHDPEDVDRHFYYLYGIKPGISYDITDKLTALFHFGFIGYSSNEQIYGFNKFGMNLSMSSAYISFYYNFKNNKK